jgi:Domain of unkown function (DUF1775)
LCPVAVKGPVHAPQTASARRADHRAAARCQYLNFPVSAGPFPEDADRLVFKAVQTYSNGEVVRWIQDAPEGRPEPERPAPILTLTPAATSGTPQPAATGTGASAQVTQADVDAAAPRGTVGIVLGALGLLLGAAGLVAGLRRPAPATLAAEHEHAATRR